MSLTNPLGDVSVTDPQAMRALAHPVRLAVLSYLQRNGPATATQLAPHVGATPSVTSWHLRHLATFGLVLDADPSEVPGDRRQRWWKAAARGFRVQVGESDEAVAAALVLADQLVDVARRQVETWLTETAPGLDHAWARVAGVSNTGLVVTAAELEELEDEIDVLLGRYVMRPDRDVPADARPVRVLRHFLPSGDPLPSPAEADSPLPAEADPPSSAEADSLLSAGTDPLSSAEADSLSSAEADSGGGAS
jgi:DNA-binding transcriptional ArsR family regulator